MSSFVLEDCWEYNFAPFFTIQPNLETRKVQLEAWNNLILSYCQNKLIYKLDLNSCSNDELFNNVNLKRCLNLASLQIVLDSMAEKGNIEWLNKDKTLCFVYWKKPSQWAQLIYEWAQKNGFVNTVCTLYEIVSGDDTQNEPFHGLDLNLLKKSISFLEKESKAVLITFDDNEGVKFL